MNKTTAIVILLFALIASSGNAQPDSPPDFSWDNCSYYNLNTGDSILFKNTKIKLLQLENHFSQIKAGEDTVWLKVSRRALPKAVNGIRIFVADNKNVKSLTSDKPVHGLLKKDALICLSELEKPMIDDRKYIFPVSFNDGYNWSAAEDSYMFAWLGLAEYMGDNFYRSHEGIDFDMHDARGLEKHWLVAMENSRVVWIEDDAEENQACVLLESESQPGIYYVYQHLYDKNVVVKKGEKLVRGEPVGTIWGDNKWGHLHLSVVHSDTVPVYQNRYHHSVNFFPQVYELYFSGSYNYNRSFSKGRILFGQPRWINGNRKNAHAFEPWSGKGWDLGRWNTAEKVEYTEKGNEGNVRLRKTLFAGTPAACSNPDDYFEYCINVRNGVYRIRAKMGDWHLNSWQKVEFEGVEAGRFALEPGEFEWTSERVVKVKDGRLTVRVYTDTQNNTPSGISEIVFQRAY